MIEEIAHENSKTNGVQLLIQNIETVIKGQRKNIEFIITTLLAKGHVLLEDNPGMGKTVMAKALAHSIATSHHDEQVYLLFKRIQFTPDLLPMDLIGSHIFDEEKKDFIFKKGPLFCNVLLADEINRASPKVQSALLECMAENQITVAETTYQLEQLFFTIATQNPVEMEGTYPLPAAQLDRFFMKLQFGYVQEETELDIYKNYRTIGQHLLDIKPVLSFEQVLHLQQAAEEIFIHDELVAAVRNIVIGTRHHSDILLGASTRSGITFIKCLKAFALVQNRDYVIEDDIQTLAEFVLNHRMIYRTREAQMQLLPAIVRREMERLSRLKLFS